MAEPAVPTGNTYDKYASANPVERRLMAGFFDALDASLPTIAPARVLEVGMGEGEVATRIVERWPDASFTGIDLPDPELAGSWGAHGLAGSFADIVDLPFADDTFDLVLAIEVLEHVDDPPAALREIGRVGSGAIVVSVPREPIWRAANMARGKYIGALGNTPGHINHWGKRSFAALVGDHADVRSVRSPLPWTMVSATLR